MSGGFGLGPILFAYDGRDGAKAAIRQAGLELRDSRSAIVLTVWEPDGPAPMGRVNRLEGRAWMLADEGARLARRIGFDAAAIAERGQPVWKRIVQSAEERFASVVVLGAHRRYHTRPVPMGSTVALVAKHTRQPLLIVPASRPTGLE
jgi:nucleotide-binding universal stress UspA family protein